MKYDYFDIAIYDSDEVRYCYELVVYSKNKGLSCVTELLKDNSGYLRLNGERIEFYVVALEKKLYVIFPVLFKSNYFAVDELFRQFFSGRDNLYTKGYGWSSFTENSIAFREDSSKSYTIWKHKQ